MKAIMPGGMAHAFVLEHKDKLGRRWCRTCGLPETNARAQVLHDEKARADWRAAAYDRSQGRAA